MPTNPSKQPRSSLSLLFNDRTMARLVGTIIALILIFISAWSPTPIKSLRHQTFDLMIRQWPAPLGRTPIKIVDIDSKSLAAHGQWPWPRSTMGRLLTIIGNGKPKAIGLDIVFAEPDRTSPSQLAKLVESTMPAALHEYIQTLPDHDLLLALALHNSISPIILGHVFTNNLAGSQQEPRLDPSRFITKGSDPRPFLHQFEQIDTNLPILAGQAHSSGFFNVLPDNDGIVRNEPLLINFRNQLAPSLILEMLRLGMGADHVVVNSDANGVTSLTVGSHTIPTDRQGQFTVHYSGPARTVAYLSADDLLSGEISANIFRDSYVLIGTSAPGLMDIRATPTDQIFPGVEIHAHALNTVLTNAYLAEPEWARGAELVYLLLVSLILILLVPKVGALKSGILSLLFSGSFILFSFWSFHHLNLLIDASYPLLTTGILFSALTFSNYLQEEQKATMIRTAFSQYLSPTLVKELINNKQELTLGGEERAMTILFSDIRSFTSLSERMTPNELCTFLNEYLTPMTEVIMENRGTVDKFIGDAIMAFWNAPLDDSDHAAEACYTALKMNERLRYLNGAWQQQKRPTIAIGIGIHCGIARVGNMGSKHRFDYTVIGDSVNLASRLEGLNKLYGTSILVSGATRELLKDRDFIFREIDRVRVKGKSKPVTVFELIRATSELDATMVKELADYQQALQAYRQRDFADAASRFKELQATNHCQRLYKLYAKRCQEFTESPPPADWEGIFDLIHK